MHKDFNAADWKKYLPVPVCDDHPEYEEFYMKAWELAKSHVKSIPGMPQAPYMDEALCDTQVWIWDSCFMAQFCKFAGDVFPGVETFSNFYEVLYGEKSLPQITPREGEPTWTKAIPGEKSDIYIHIADNPPLFAWGEYENALFSADTEHIADLLYNKQYLQKHYEWFDNLKSEEKPRGVFLPTCLIAEDVGFRWEGGRSGMDNTPRGRKMPRDGKERPQNPDLLWIDALCQQALSAKMIAKLFDILGDRENEALWLSKFESKKALVNHYYWDSEDGFYYDIDVNTHEFCKVMTPASFWTMTAGIASLEQAKKIVKRVIEPETLGGDVPLISLSRNDGDYYTDGRYWRGGLWLPTAYAALKGLTEYNFHAEAHEAGYKIFRHMLKTYQNYEPHTIWECYSPEEASPALIPNGTKTSRPDFCGWSALGPISIYIEYVLGFNRVNAFERIIEWTKPSEFLGEIGIKNLKFGDIVTSVTAKGNSCRVVSNSPYKLKINDRTYEISAGTQEFNI